MCLRVHARLVRGCPCVELRDELSGAVRYSWSSDLHAADIHGHDVQDLIRMLLLASAQTEARQAGQESG